MEKEAIRASYYLDSYVVRDVINSWCDSRSVERRATFQRGAAS